MATTRGSAAPDGGGPEGAPRTASRDRTGPPPRWVPEDAAGPRAAWRDRLHAIIFEAETPAGKLFDVALLIAIVASIVVVSLDSVAVLQERYGSWFFAAEVGFTALFTVEYALRLMTVSRPRAYAMSFYGIVDLLAILPTYLILLGIGAGSFVFVRALRLLRVFRVFKLAHFLTEADSLRGAIWDARAKIVVFLTTVLTIVAITGAAMYVVEGPANGFDSIPQSMYWAVVTLTTVGYGDIAPQTPFGKLLAALIMVMGYSLIIVPTGILSAELATRASNRPPTTAACHGCGRHGHAPDAVHCKWCGEQL